MYFYMFAMQTKSNLPLGLYLNDFVTDLSLLKHILSFNVWGFFRTWFLFYEVNYWFTSQISTYMVDESTEVGVLGFAFLLVLDDLNCDGNWGLLECDLEVLLLNFVCAHCVGFLQLIYVNLS